MKFLVASILTRGRKCPWLVLWGGVSLVLALLCVLLVLVPEGEFVGRAPWFAVGLVIQAGELACLYGLGWWLLCGGYEERGKGRELPPREWLALQGGNILLLAGLVFVLTGQGSGVLGWAMPDYFWLGLAACGVLGSERVMRFSGGVGLCALGILISGVGFIFYSGAQGYFVGRAAREIEVVFCVVLCAVGVVRYCRYRGIGQHIVLPTWGRWLWLFLPVMIYFGYFLGMIVMPAVRFAAEPAFRSEDGYFSIKNRGLAEEGARIYGQMGCIVCHTQEVSPASVWRDGWNGQNRRGAWTFSPRYTIPDDYVGLSVAPLGRTFLGGDIGGDLSNFGSEIDNKLLAEDGAGGCRYATATQWLALHLYNPRDAVFGSFLENKSRRKCPSYAFLFEEKMRYTPWLFSQALPVDMPLDRQLVPTRRGQVLIAYLEQLRMNQELPTALVASRAPYMPWRSFGEQGGGGVAVLPLPGQGEVINPERVFERLGAKTFSQQCAVCHGQDGTGDGYNYPPLVGSEWSSLSALHVAEIVLRGLRGPLVVAGKSWDNYMTPHGDRLNDAQVAAVVHYVQKRFWAKEPQTLSDSALKALRAKLAGKGPFPASELGKKP